MEVGPRGSWLIPDLQKQAVQEIAAALEQAAPDLGPAIRQRVQQRLRNIDSTAAECREALTAVQGRRVICAIMQAEFVLWAGLDVIQTSYNFV